MRLNSFIFDSDFLQALVPARVMDSLSTYTYLGSLNLDRMLLPFLLMGLLLLLVILAGRKKWQFRSVIYFVGGIIFFRLMLFGNPVAWYLHSKLLGWNDVGFRQVNVIDNELRHYFDPPDEVRFLAIGSSQTGAIYGDYAKNNSDLYKVELSGLGPTEYYLYRDIVGKVKPEQVLLYLSEFDIARSPSYDTYRYAPRQWWSLVSYTLSLRKNEKSDEMGVGLKELWIAQIFPEFKYSFIFKGYLRKWLGLNKVFELDAESFNVQLKEDKIRSHVGSLKEILDMNAIENSMAALTYFFEYCKSQGLQVAIIEGSYHPDAYNQKNLTLQSLVNEKMVQISELYENIEFVSHDKISTLLAEDFMDGYHLTAAAGDRVTHEIIKYIDRSGESVLTDDL